MEGWSDYQVLTDVPNVEKMSEVIPKFAEPLIDSAGDNDEAYKNAVAMAILVWNASLMPEDEQDSFLNEMIEDISGSSAEDYAMSLQIIDMLLDRKRKYFKENNRFIVDFEIRCTENDRHLSVVSTTQPPKEGRMLPSPTRKKPWWKLIPWRK
jgi:hypothetical protein